MSTRRADPNAPLSQERYMSSPEFAGLQGISGTAVAKRCALLVSPVKRQLLWFIQGMSLTEGGLNKMARELLKMFPERINTSDVDPYSWESENKRSDAELRQECHEVALRRKKRDGWTHDPVSIEEFLIDLCINPRLTIPLKQGELETSEFEVELARDKFPELGKRDFSDAKLGYFDDAIGALVEYKRRYEEQARTEFCLTAIGRQIWNRLDYALKSRTMVVVDGLEGRGKTEAVRAWCKCHLGVARFISLVGTNTKTSHFTEFAKALGVGHSNTHKVSQMQAGVQTVLRTSGLMAVIDEAHFFFNQAPRMKTRPEMLDWIDTALCNPPSPLALITTPQFLLCVERAVDQVGWNYRQFKRRGKYCRLPANNTPEDIEAVTRHLLPGAKSAIIKQVSGYAALSKRDLSAVGDIVRDAKLLAEDEGAAQITFEHIARATGLLFESDKPWAEMERRLQNKKLGRKALRHLPDIGAEVAPEAAQEPPGTHGRNITPRLAPSAPRGNRMRLQEPVSALIREPSEAILTPV